MRAFAAGLGWAQQRTAIEEQIMDEERIWAEVLAAQALSITALNEVATALSRGDAAQYHALVRRLHDVTLRTLELLRPSHAPDAVILRAHQGAEGRLDEVFAVLAAPRASEPPGGISPPG